MWVANFGNGDTRIGFVQKMQNLAVGMLRVSHRPYAFMCHRQSFNFGSSVRSRRFLSARLGCVFTFCQERIRCDCIIARTFSRVEPNGFREACANSGAVPFCHLPRAQLK